MDFVDSMLSITGTLVSILLGLLVAGSLERYQNLEQTVDIEAASCAQIFHLAGALQPGPCENIRNLCVDYCNQVVHSEWPEMAKKNHSHETSIALMRLASQIQKFAPDTNGETNIHAQMLSAVQQVGESRNKRILFLRSTWIYRVLPILLFSSIIVLSFAYLRVNRNALTQTILVSIVTLALVGNLDLVYVLSDPFGGDWKIQPRGFDLNFDFLDEINADSSVDKSFKFIPAKR
jgi:hypothetical protein